MGNQKAVVIIADHKTTPEGSAIQQLNRTAALDHIVLTVAVPTDRQVGDDGSGALQISLTRSEERRVGKECRSRWSPYH